ncbi:MAG: hypothetical protein H7A26_04045 [Spirochaetales bacterium]|nr:hypothetical protein [Spirochaetales bacterium]
MNKKYYELIIKKLIFLIYAAAIFLSCDQYSLEELVDGPDGKALSISPVSTTLQVLDSVKIETSGGIPPYSYAVAGGGIFTGNTYTAPAAPGTAVITVEDSVNSSIKGVYTIIDSTVPVIPSGNIDYYISTPPAGGVGISTGSPVSAGFIVSNQGSDDGTVGVIWQAYISSDVLYDSGDTPVDSGMFGGLLSGGNSGLITIDNGNWNAEGTWYLVIRLQCTEEVNTTNNIRSSSPYFISDLSGIDYVVSNVSRTFPTVSGGSSVSETFTITNIGGEDGAMDITWTAYASLNTVPDAGEEIGSGIITGGLDIGASMTGITAVGTWPEASGNYYLIIKSFSNDEVNQGDYAYNPQTTQVASPPDYTIESPVFTAMTAGGNINETLLSAAGGTSPGFSIRNLTANPGIQTINWKIYKSADTAVGTGDTVVASGSLAPLAGNTVSGPLSFNDTLPGSRGAHYYIIQISSPDDSDFTNNTLVSPLTYYWSVNGNSESDTNEDDNSLSTADDFFIRLNPGDTVNIQGLVDTSTSNDLFLVRTGPSTGRLNIALTWATGANDLDFYIYQSLPTVINSSTLNTFNSEPTVPPLAINVNPNSSYLIQVRATPSSNLGAPYTLTVEGLLP